MSLRQELRVAQGLEADLAASHRDANNDWTADRRQHHHVLALADACRAANDHELLRQLARQSRPGQRFDVKFLLASVPDYVDSQSGWMADSILTGLQYGFTSLGFAMDRFLLPDWAPGTAPPTQPGASVRGVHERQPGALIFRESQPSGRIVAHSEFVAPTKLWVVLLVPETPTGGIHRAAFVNATALIAAWEGALRGAPEEQSSRVTDASGCHSPSGDLARPEDLEFRLDVLGPTFSGSLLSLKQELEQARKRWPKVNPHVAIGSANARLRDGLARVAVLRTHVTDSETLMSFACSSLDRLGFVKDSTELLVESTGFGESVVVPRKPRAGEANAACWQRTHRYPLHVAQLRNDSASASGTASRPGTEARVRVDVREASASSDVMPALRRGLASPAVEANLSGLFDGFRRRRVRVVGIVATDARDVLFLSRQIREHAPNVQLVVFAAQSLYVHAEYAPYLRGAIVVSAYPLSPVCPGCDSENYQFPSMEAQGVFHAVRETVGPVIRGTAAGPPVPSSRSNSAAYLSVVGSDSFWPFEASSPVSNGADAHPLSIYPLLTVLGVFLMAASFSWSVARTALWLHRQKGLPPRQRSRPPVALLAPPAARFGSWPYAIGIARAGALISVLTAGGVLVLMAPNGSHPRLRIVLAGMVAIGVAGLAAWLSLLSLLRGGREPRLDGVAKRGSLIVAILAGGTVATTACLAWHLVSSSDMPMVAWARERTAEAGIASPAPITILLAAALLIPIFFDHARAFGPGMSYARWSRNRTFQFLMGSDGRDRNVTELAKMLDDPLRRTSMPMFIGFGVTVGALAVTLRGHGQSLEGPAFSWFMWLATVTALARVTVQLTRSVRFWNLADIILTRITHRPHAPALKRVTPRHVPWDLSLLNAKVDDLLPMVELARHLRHGLPGLADAEPISQHWPRLIRLLPRRPRPGIRLSISLSYRRESSRLPRVRLAASRTWLALWATTRHLVPILQATRWKAGGAPVAPKAPLLQLDEWLKDAELFVAVQVGFVIRDMVKRVVTTMLIATVSLGLVTAAHLSYVFQGRTAFLMVDAVYLLVSAMVALWLLITIERDHVISLLRDTKPGRITWDANFIRGVAGYVVLPLVAAVATVFPEVGIHLTGLLEPLRGLMGQ